MQYWFTQHQHQRQPWFRQYFECSTTPLTTTYGAVSNRCCFPEGGWVWVWGPFNGGLSMLLIEVPLLRRVLVLRVLCLLLSVFYSCLHYFLDIGHYEHYSTTSTTTTTTIAPIATPTPCHTPSHTTTTTTTPYCDYYYYYHHNRH